MANKITINGQQYDSPEAMPPEVRRTYEEAMRALASSLARGQGGGTQVFTGQAGQSMEASVVVNRVVTVNNRTYGSVDELPPDMRQRFEDALEGASPQMTHPKSSLKVSVSMKRPEARTPGDSADSIDPTSTEGKIREFPKTLAIAIVTGLILWARLGCQ